MKTFLQILAAIAICIPFAVSCLFAIAALMAICFGSVHSTPEECIVVFTAYSYLIYALLTGMRGFDVERVSKLSLAGKIVFTVITVCYVFSIIGFLAAM